MSDVYSCCPVCYKAGHGSNDGEGGTDTEEQSESEEFGKRREVQFRFFKLFGRYLDLDSDKEGNGGRNHQGSRSGRRMKDLLFPLKQLLLELGMDCCEACCQLMEEFSEVYHRLKIMEMELKGKVWKLKTIMEGAQHPSPRLKYFRACVGNVAGRVGQEVNGGGGDGVVDSVFKSKEALIQKCSQKLTNGFPKLPLVKLPTPSPPTGVIPMEGGMLTWLIPTDTDDVPDYVKIEMSGSGGEDYHSSNEIEMVEDNTWTASPSPTPPMEVLQPTKAVVVKRPRRTLSVVKDAEWRTNAALENLRYNKPSKKRKRSLRQQQVHRCAKCWKGFSSEELLQSHIEEAHAGSDSDEAAETDHLNWWDSRRKKRLAKVHAADVEWEPLKVYQLPLKSSSYFQVYGCPPSSTPPTQIPEMEGVKAAKSANPRDPVADPGLKKLPLKLPHSQVHPPTPPTLEESSKPAHEESVTPLYLNVINDDHAFFRLKCPDCQLLFKDMKAILTHRKTSESCKASYDPSTSVNVEVFVPFAGWDGRLEDVDDSIFTTRTAIIDLPQAIFTCEGCRVTVYSSEDMEAHQTIHNPIPCPICDFPCPDAPALATHHALEHSEKYQNRNGASAVAQCPYSGCHYPYAPTCRELYIRHYLKEHLGLPLKKPVHCAICKTDPPQMGPSKLAQHLRSHHDVTHTDGDPHQMVLCTEPNCTAYFLGKAPRKQFKNHLRYRHSISLPSVKGLIKQRKLRCRDCQKYFPDQDTLRHHRIKHHIPPDQAIPCELFPKCKKLFESQADLQQHMKRAKKAHQDLDNPANRGAPCPKCNKLIRQSNMESHLKSHEKQKESAGFVCDLCGKVYKMNHELQRHKLTHQDPETWKFSCGVCSKRFVNKGGLDNHMLVHTKEKPLVCDICGNSYARQCGLKWHLSCAHGIGKKVIYVPYKGKRKKKPKKREASSMSGDGGGGGNQVPAVQVQKEEGGTNVEVAATEEGMMMMINIIPSGSSFEIL